MRQNMEKRPTHQLETVGMERQQLCGKESQRREGTSPNAEKKHLGERDKPAQKESDH